jgi:hypothetical protein
MLLAGMLSLGALAFRRKSALSTRAFASPV